MEAEKSNEATETFEREARANSPTLLIELWLFIKSNKKWWLTPIIVVFIIFGVLVVLSATGAAPFIYTLF